ncbi:MAG: sugar phosphate isomerase/epimerase [Sedimentisphaerales bacterium]|nr:sugar phosphate isomerase/epimerase [Sedimentisphaerales bacterium]
MIQCGKWPVGVCSWSLQTDVKGVADAMKQIGLSHVHLAVTPAVGEQGKEYLAAVKQQDWTISATMVNFPQEDYSTLDSIRVTGGIAPDDCWPQNRDLFFAAADITAELGVKYLSMHLGFLDHHDLAYARKFFERTKELADKAGQNDLILLLETGQESAADLQHFLKEFNHPSVGVNFDPANMILYDKGDPIEAVRVLAPWIKHIHIKDANRTQQIGTWGAEVPWGDGQVGMRAFLEALKEVGFEGVLAIEREAGDDRIGDIKLAAERLSQFTD